MNYIGDNMKIKKEFIELIFLFSAAILLIAFSSSAKSGAFNGLEMAGRIVIPSLLPLLIIINLISNAETKNIIEKILSPFTEKILRLPRSTGSAVFFGLIGGYPTGALLTDSLYSNEDIDSETAKRLLRFNVNGGAAFIITATGTSVLKSWKAGIILFASTTAAALLIAFLSSFHYKKINYPVPGYSSLSLGEALNKSTEISIRAVLNITAYIVLFSAISNILTIPQPLIPIFEITNGIVENFRIFTLPELAGLLSFAGLCIHFQLLSVIKKIGMHYFDFFIWRVFHSVLSYGICFLLLKVFPTETAVFSNLADITAKPISVNTALSVLMILGCAVIILDIESRKRKI